MKIPIAAILLAICSTPTLADVTGSYAENTPTEISYLQLVHADSSISGSIKAIDAVTTSPGYKISDINIAGSAHGATLFIRIDDGLLGSSGLFTGDGHKRSSSHDYRPNTVRLCCAGTEWSPRINSEERYSVG